jgi:hypothetical protein
MKIRIVGFLAGGSLLLAFALLTSTPAAPHKANAPATPAANALPATPPAARPAEPHPANPRSTRRAASRERAYGTCRA